MSNNKFGWGWRSAAVVLVAAFACGVAGARERAVDVAGCGGPRCAPVLTTGAIDVAFSPGPAGEALVIKVIDSAREGGSIRLMAYSFTSAPIVAALLRAKRERHVDLALVVDQKDNVQHDARGKARAALGALAAAGVQIRTVNAFAIAHDKVIIVDGRHVQTGSFNYSAAAAKSNSENVIVVWDSPQLAYSYMEHWQRNWDLGQAWQVPF